MCSVGQNEVKNYFLNIYDTNNHIHKLCVDNLIDSLKLFNLFRWKWVQMKEKYNGEKKKVFSSVFEHDVLAYKNNIGVGSLTLSTRLWHRNWKSNAIKI